MRIWILMAVLILLGGCSFANVQGEWDCEAQQGKACVSISEADGGPQTSNHLDSGSTGVPATFLHKPPAQVSVVPSSGHELRTGEVIGRVWFFPFVDAANNYHEAAALNVVLRAADWRIGEVGPQEVSMSAPPQESKVHLEDEPMKLMEKFKKAREESVMDPSDMRFGDGTIVGEEDK